MQATAGIMNELFFKLALVCVGMCALLAGGVLVILATSPPYRREMKRTGFWVWSAVLAVGCGLGLAFWIDSSQDQQTAIAWGRILMSSLHLVLGVDIFLIGIIYVLNKVWPKGGAVVMAAFREGVRQPMFWLLVSLGLLLMLVSPWVPYFTFGEDLKMVKELCFAIAMLAPALFGVIAAAISVSEEIEGRTAVTLMSKPVSRRQFLLGKFGGTLLAALAMTLLLGWVVVWVIILKRSVDAGIPGVVDQAPDPTWVVEFAEGWLSRSSAADFVKGAGFWIQDAGEALPILIVGFCQVMILVAIATALATRFPMMVNLAACLFIYFLGHLTPVMKAVTTGQYRLLGFVADVFDTVVPGLDLFDAGSAVIRDLPLPLLGYIQYTFNTVLYAATFTAIALLLGLILFEDRDLA